MTGISKKASQAVVSEIIAILGESDAAQAIGATGARLKSLAGGKGQLSSSALEQIRAVTGKTWRTWLLGAIKRAGASHQIISPTSDMVHNLNRAEFDAEKPVKGSRRPRATRVA